MTGIAQNNVNSVLAMITATVHATEGGSANDPQTLQAVAKTIKEVPSDELAMICSHVIALLLRQLGREQGKSVEDVWRTIALVYASTWPEDQPDTDTGR